MALVPSIETIAEGWDKYRETLRNEGECDRRSEHEPRADEAAITSTLAPPTIEDQPMPNLELSMVDEVEAKRNSHSKEGREIAGEQDIVGTSPVSGDAEMELVKPLSGGADMEDQTKDLKCNQKAVEDLKNDDDSRAARSSIASLSEAERESCEDWLMSTSLESDREHWRSTQSGSEIFSEAEKKKKESCPGNLFGGKAAVVPWLLSRMGLLEKVAVNESNHSNLVHGKYRLGDD